MPRNLTGLAQERMATDRGKEPASERTPTGITAPRSLPEATSVSVAGITEPLTKTSVFVRLGSYFQPENDRAPHRGVHVCHVLVIFSVEQQPWRSLAGWMRTAANPFPRGSWIVCSGRLLGVMDRNLIQGPQLVDPTVRILVIFPDDWEFVRQNALTANSTKAAPSSNAVAASPTTPRRAGAGGVTSRNPFSSPSSGRKLPLQKKASPLTPTGPGAPLNPTTADDDPVLTIPSSGMSRFFHAHDTTASANCRFR